MPDTYGKRQREGVKARKAAAKEERRNARNQRRDDRAAGIPTSPPGTEEWPDGDVNGSEEGRPDSAPSEPASN